MLYGATVIQENFLHDRRDRQSGERFAVTGEILRSQAEAVIEGCDSKQMEKCEYMTGGTIIL